MKGAILQKQKMYYTHMDKVFTAINDIQVNYNWLITDYECNLYPDERISYGEEYVWISGEELTDIVYNNNIQFIWGVFSAFRKDITPNDIMKYPLPCADENQNFWVSDVNIQHPLSEIEIVPFDSTLVLVISRSDDIVDAFMRTFPMAEDLAVYNAGYYDSK